MMKVQKYFTTLLNSYKMKDFLLHSHFYLFYQSFLINILCRIFLTCLCSTSNVTDLQRACIVTLCSYHVTCIPNTDYWTFLSAPIVE